MGLQVAALVLGDDRATGEDGDVVEHLALFVTKAGRLDHAGLQHLGGDVDDQGGEGLALDVLGDDEERALLLHGVLEHGNEFLRAVDALVGHQDEGRLEHRFAALLVGHHVGGHVALVELHAVHDFEFGFHGLRVFDGDDAFASDLVKGLGDERPNLGVVVGRDGRDLTDHVAAVDLDGAALEVLHHGRNGRIEAGLEGHGACACGHVAHALVHQSLGHHRGGGGPVAGVVLRL